MTFELIRLIELCRGCSREKANSFHEDVPLISLMRVHNYSGMPLRPGGICKQWFGEGGVWGFFSQFAALEKKPRQHKRQKRVCHSSYEKWTKVRLRQLRYMYRPDCARMCVCACVRSSAAWLCKNDTEFTKNNAYFNI